MAQVAGQTTNNMSRPFCRWIEDRCEISPSSAALIYNNTQISYDDLRFDVEQQVHQLKQTGLQPGAIWMVEQLEIMDLAVSLHAIPRAGSIFMPLDPNLPSKSKTHLHNLVQSVKGFEKQPPHPDAVHVIIATSGTTGTPKGVMLTGENLAAAARASRQRIGLTPSDRWLACLPLFHIGGLSILTRCAEVGACAVLQNGFDVDEALNAMDNHGITHLSVVPTMLHGFLEKLDGHPPPGRLKRVLVGGAALSKKLADRALEAGWPLCPTYGMSETSSQCMTMETLPDNWQEGQTGTALNGFDIQLEEQRIKVRGPAVMSGYLNEDGKTGVGLEKGWFKTNDLAVQNTDTSYNLLGRADDVFIIGGKNVHPVLIEQTLEKCPDVDDLAVSAIEDEKWGQSLVVVYCGQAQEQQILEFAATHLKGAYKPRRAVKLDQLPRNQLGKLDRVKLKEFIR